MGSYHHSDGSQFGSPESKTTLHFFPSLVIHRAGRHSGRNGMCLFPYRRRTLRPGGSPLQNLICRGHKETVLTALKMTDELDAGPVYFKRALSLEGTAEQIFARAAELTMEMIGEIVRDEPTPTPQTGEATFFQRRKPEQSLVPPEADLAGLYDHIRMLDAEGYPHAFIDHGCWRAHFTGAKIAGDAVEARVRFEIKNKKKP